MLLFLRFFSFFLPVSHPKGGPAFSRGTPGFFTCCFSRFFTAFALAQPMHNGKKVNHETTDDYPKGEILLHSTQKWEEQGKIPRFKARFVAKGCYRNPASTWITKQLHVLRAGARSSHLPPSKIDAYKSFLWVVYIPISALDVQQCPNSPALQTIVQDMFHHVKSLQYTWRAIIF